MADRIGVGKALVHCTQQAFGLVELALFQPRSCEDELRVDDLLNVVLPAPENLERPARGLQS